MYVLFVCLLKNTHLQLTSVQQSASFNTQGNIIRGIFHGGFAFFLPQPLMLIINLW